MYDSGQLPNDYLCLNFSIYKEEMILSTSQDYCVDLDNEAIIKGYYK